jgi:hypothetical protein
VAGVQEDPVLEALWKRTLSAWDDERTHAALLEQAMRSQRLPELATSYRALLDDPDRGVLAKKRLDAIVVAATQMLVALKTPPRRRTPLPITLSALGICALLLSWLAYALWGTR